MSEQAKKKELKTVTPHSLITEEYVRKALAADKGDDVILKSWTVVDFTKQGDNYACVVSSVQVKFSHNNESHDVTYVVKLNPCTYLEELDELTTISFEKEFEFYTILKPKLNSVLENIGHDTLKVPQCFHGSLEKGYEIIFLEDLRKKGFKMFDRKIGMNFAHLRLALQEVAKLHAASLLLQEKYELSGDSLILKHSYLKKDWFHIIKDGKYVFRSLLERFIDNGTLILEGSPGYDDSLTWVKNLKHQLDDITGEKALKGRCNVINHGDFWNNNMLFRYDERGLPTEVMLLDFQLIRYASPATDLNYLLYTSVEGQVRKPNLEAFLSIYISTMKEIMEAGGLDMPFTEEELMEEFKAKRPFGALMAMILIPVVLMESTDAPDMSEMKDMKNFTDDFRVKIKKMLKEEDSLLKPRFLSMFDEFRETGLFG